MLKRLLFVTPFALLPAAEGHRKRMEMTLREIRRHGYQVDILFISKEYGWSDRFNRRAFRDMAALADNFFHVHQPTPSDPAGPVYLVDEWWNEELDRYCEWLFANNGYEAVFCNYVFMSRVFEGARFRTRRLLETHDVFTGRKEMLADQGLRPEFFYTSRAEERKGVQRADTVIAIKDEEAEFFQRLTAGEVVTLPFVEPTVAGALAPRMVAGAGGPLVFGFFGSANSLNVQAVTAFSDHLVRADEPADGSYEVHLYGTLCDRLGGALHPAIRIMGRLPEPRDFYSAVDCVLNFQQASTGLKIKVAEALSFGVPLLSLAHAFEGFGQPAHPAQACRDLPALVQAMRRAATEPAFLAAVGEGARTVQQALVRRTDRMATRLFATAETDPALVFVVDGATYARSPAYRHLVASFRLAFIRSWAACLFVASGEEPAGEFRAFADQFGRVADEHDLPALAPRSVLLLFAADAVSPEVAARFARVVVVAPACDYAEPDAARRPLATSLPAIVVRGRGGGPARRLAEGGRTALHLSLFRWIPWDLALAQRPQHFTRVSETWVFGADGNEEALTRLLGSIPGAGTVRGADVATAHRRLFEERAVPAMVVAVGACEDWALALEWLDATGVEVRHLDRPAGDSAKPPRPLRSTSALVRPVVPRPADAATPLGDWHASGWAGLAELVGLPADR